MALPHNVDATWANAPDAVSDPVYDGADLRRADTGIFAGHGTTSVLGVRGGIALHSLNSLGVTVDGSDVVTVQPGAVIIPGDAVSGTGCYRTALASATTGSLAARHATLGRIDLLVFRMLDVDVVAGHGAGNRKGQISLIAGTPSGSPAVPVKPSMAIELARITVPATGGGAATVDSSKRTFASALGGELIVTTASELPSPAPPWQRARALDTGVPYTFNPNTAVWDAGEWEVWTPTWSASTTNPVIGNGTLVGRFKRDGKKIDFYIHLTIGSTTSNGVGFYSFDLPVPEVARPWSFDGYAFDTSLGDYYAIKSIRQASDSTGLIRADPTSAGGPLRGVGATTLFTWATGDVLYLWGMYEAA